MERSILGKMNAQLTLVLVFSALVLGGEGFAQDPMSSEVHAPAGTSTRGKRLEIEGIDVEGMNKRPMDYQLTISKRRTNTGHIYDKAISFEKDLKESLREMRYSQ